MLKTWLLPALFAALSLPLAAQQVVEFPLVYPHAPSVETGACHPAPAGSTHEITFDAARGHDLWITGQNYDTVVRLTESGAPTYYAMPVKSGPHGIEFDADHRLWVTLEFAGQIVRLDENGAIDRTIDVRLDCPTCPNGEKLNTHPHGLGIGADGHTMWFTGKSTGTVGKVTPDGKVTTYVLPTVGSVPIYVRAGSDGTMWVTELVGNAIARITADGTVKEFPIPTHNSRPIAIVPEPGSDAMWFSEEAGNRVGRIARDGTIAEYPVPMTQSNVILAGLGFDSAKNLWVQQYIDQNSPAPANPSPAGADYVLRIDRSILTTAPSDLSRVPIAYFRVPSTQTVMHRIVQGPDGNLWFTELATNKVGKVMMTNPSTTAAGLDHILLGVPSLDEGMRAFERATGVAATRGGKHPTLGTENALISLGPGRYLELIAPRADADAADPFVQQLRGLHAPAVVGWAVHVPSAADAAARLTRAGFRATAPQPGSRVTPAGATLRWTTFEAVPSPPIDNAPFFIEWDPATPHPSTTSPAGCTLARFDVADPHAAELARLLAALGVDVAADVAVRSAAKPAMRVELRCGGRVATFGE